MDLKLVVDINIDHVLILRLALTLNVLFILHHTFAILTIAHLVHYRINLRDFSIFIFFECFLVFFGNLYLVIQEFCFFFFILDLSFIFFDASKV